MEVSNADKYDDAFKGALKARSTALVVTQSPLAVSNRKLDRRAGGEKSAAGNIHAGRFCGQRGFDVLWA